TLHAYFAAEGILHQTSVSRTPEQNGVVERRNRTLVKATRKMLSAAKVPLFFWAEAITMALNHDSLSPAIQRQENVTQADRTVTTSNELDLLFSLMFDELLNGSAPIQCQHHTTPLNNHTTPAPKCQAPTLEPTVISSENINQAETYAKNAQVADDEFVNIFSTLVQDQGETSLQQVIGNPSQSVRTRQQLESDAEMCMFVLTVSRTEPKNIKEAMADFA
nr:putative ribonuclease H-like domain-containing protein [Tanacetum cinerariifolium]